MHQSHREANLRWKAGQIPQALEKMAAAAKSGEDSAQFHVDYASLLMVAGDFPASLEHHNKAAEANPGWQDAAFRRGLMHLIQGEYEQGWPLYRQRKSAIAPHLKPKWNGEQMPGGSILLYTDQGLGDAIQFVRYAQLVKDRCAQLKLLCKPKLVDLLGTAFPFDELFLAQDNQIPPAHAYDRWAGLADLPAIFQTFVNNQQPPLPATFAVEHGKKAHWKEKLDQQVGYQVGVAWRGSDENPLHPVRDIPAIAFKALSHVKGIRLVTLQQHPRGDEVGKLGREKAVTDLTKEMSKNEWTLLDTAAVIRNLDLVVTCDTMVAHLAASLGKDTWIAVAPYPDWRWGLAGTATPWYPDHVTLYRRPVDERWEEYLKDIASDLKNRPGVPGLPPI